jgi:lipopolysaccharide/colanic/teichoic acid biosynthesis glycosyltransferase
MKNYTRKALLEELTRRYDRSDSRGSLNYLRKKYAWLIVTRTTSLIKRTMDILVAVIFLVGLSPLLVLVALIIYLTDRGPVIYTQKRVGKWGREFSFPKFRSMVVNADEIRRKILDQSHHADSLTFKMANDPRITWIGGIIRKLSIDELPQLWNVLKGDMSLVGPRPPLPEEVARYTLKDRRRLDVTPGLTCTWQVSGRSDIPFDEQVKLDVAYIESKSIMTDIRILFKTIPAVLSGKGAY